MTLEEIAAAPTNIAYLLDRVRELASDNRSLRERLNDAHEAHIATTEQLLEEITRYRRSHEWFVQNTRDARGDSPWCACGDRINDHNETPCEWVKAKELRI